MMLHRCFGSMSKSIVLAIGPLSDKSEAEGDAGVVPTTSSSLVAQGRASIDFPAPGLPSIKRL
jgi:hypothetical protein